MTPSTCRFPHLPCLDNKSVTHSISPSNWHSFVLSRVDVFCEEPSSPLRIVQTFQYVTKFNILRFDSIFWTVHGAHLSHLKCRTIGRIFMWISIDSSMASFTAARRGVFFCRALQLTWCYEFDISFRKVFQVPCPKSNRWAKTRLFLCQLPANHRTISFMNTTTSRQLQTRPGPAYGPAPSWQHITSHPFMKIRQTFLRPFGALNYKVANVCATATTQFGFVNETSIRPCHPSMRQYFSTMKIYHIEHHPGSSGRDGVSYNANCFDWTTRLGFIMDINLSTRSLEGLNLSLELRWLTRIQSIPFLSIDFFSLSMHWVFVFFSSK